MEGVHKVISRNFKKGAEPGGLGSESSSVGPRGKAPLESLGAEALKHKV